MSTERFLLDLQQQPASLSAVIQHQTGPGGSAIASAAERLRSARKVVLTGMGSSLYACIPLRLHLAQQGLNASVVDASELLHYESAALAEALVVMVSRSGESVEIERLLDRVLPASVIGVTNEPASTLARMAGEIVLVNSLEDELVALQSYTGTLAALAVLGMAVYGTGGRSWSEQLAQLPEMMRAVIEQESGRDVQDFLTGAHAFYLLGRGSSRASCREGALLFGEAAKMPAVSMEAGAFRHGPVEAVDKAFRAFLFATQEPTRALDRALATGIESFGGRVRVIGPELPSLHPLLAPVLEIVPVQFAVRRLAEARGFELNRFRYATQVTRSEESFGADD